ncbi:lysophospholipid acyltransferase family protein [Desulfocicer niacini]
MLKKLKWIIYTSPFIAFVYYFIRIYSFTFRFHVDNEKQWQQLLDQGTPILLCGWHQQFFSAIRYFKTYSKFNPGLMISRSKDGDLISGVANRTGWHTPRGSSSRGGKQAMDAMIDHLNTHGFGAHILDGPRGPMGIVKPGVIKMAHYTGVKLVPFYIKGDNAWYFKSWDRFMLPRPFSRVTLTFGSPLTFLPKSVDADSFESQRQSLEKTMLPGLVIV